MSSNFSNNWFAKQAEPLWREHLIPMFRERPMRQYIELGVAEGQSMLWVLNHLKPELAWGIDPYKSPGRRYDQKIFDTYHANAQQNLADWISADVVRLRRCTSSEYLRSGEHREIKNRSCSLAYVDGSHVAWAVIEDIVLVWDKLERGGIMVLDDLHRRILKQQPLVRPAAHSFLTLWDTRYTVLYHEPRQLAVRKVK